jgi:hypothetical protein
MNAVARRCPHSVLDLWVMVVICAWMFDIGLRPHSIAAGSILDAMRQYHELFAEPLCSLH